MHFLFYEKLFNIFMLIQSFMSNKAGIYLCFPIFFSIASGTLIKRKQVIIRTLTKKAVPLDGSKFYFFGLVFVSISSGSSSAHGSKLSSSSDFGNGPSWRSLSNTYVK